MGNMGKSSDIHVHVAGLGEISFCAALQIAGLEENISFYDFGCIGHLS